MKISFENADDITFVIIDGRISGTIASEFVRSAIIAKAALSKDCLVIDEDGKAIVGHSIEQHLVVIKENGWFIEEMMPSFDYRYHAYNGKRSKKFYTLAAAVEFARKHHK